MIIRLYFDLFLLEVGGKLGTGGRVLLECFDILPFFKINIADLTRALLSGSLVLSLAVSGFKHVIDFTFSKD